jgi:hypothetical protein
MRFLLVVSAALLMGAVVPQDPVRHAYVPPNGFVPDSLTAVRIAIAVWGPIYGDRQIANEHPLRATLRDSTWTVTGSLGPGEIGGVAIAEIAKRDGRVLRVSHTQ